MGLGSIGLQSNQQAVGTAIRIKDPDEVFTINDILDGQFLKRVGDEIVGSAPSGGAPAAHKDTHKSGGSDALLSTDLLEAISKRLQTTTGPTTLTVADIADNDVLTRSGTDIAGLSVGALTGIFCTTVGTGKDFTDLQAAIVAFEANAAELAIFVVFGDVTMNALAGTLTKPARVIGVLDDAGELPKITLDAILNMGAIGTSKEINVTFINIDLTSTSTNQIKLLGVTTISQHLEFINCIGRPTHAVNGLIEVQSSASIEWRNSRLTSATNGAPLHSLSVASSKLRLTMSGCQEIPGTVNSEIVSNGASGVVQVTLIACVLPCWTLANAGSLRLRRDASTNIDMASLAGDLAISGSIRRKPASLVHVNATTVNVGDENEFGRIEDDRDGSQFAVETVAGGIIVPITTLGSAETPGRLIDAEAANTWYAVVVAVDDIDGSVASAAYLVPQTRHDNGTYIITLEGFGYNRIGTVGWVRNDSSSDFIPFFKEGQVTFFDTDRSNVNPLSAGSAIVKTTIALANFVPPGTRLVRLLAHFAGNANGDYVSISRGDTSLTEADDWVNEIGISNISGANVQRQQATVQVDAARQLAYWGSDAGNSLTLFIIGYSHE